MDVLAVRKQLRTKTIYDLPLRVTFYARVSTDRDEQLNSLDNQIHYYEELSVKETAKILKLSVSCVSMRLTRAKEMLREALKEYSYEEIL